MTASNICCTGTQNRSVSTLSTAGAKLHHGATLGGAHHTAFSYDLTAEQMMDWADAMGIEAVRISDGMDLRQFRNEMKWNDLFYRFNR